MGSCMLLSGASKQTERPSQTSIMDLATGQNHHHEVRDSRVTGSTASLPSLRSFCLVTTVLCVGKVVIYDLLESHLIEDVCPLQPPRQTQGA